jgi:peptide/nickel transport system ATP-binding protein
MKQRVMIAAALACEPRLLIADEPTTALDVTVQAQILRLLREIRDRTGLSIVIVTHDLGVVAEACDTVGVMHRGRLVERGARDEVFARPRHEHTRALLAAQPGLSDAPAPPVREAGAPLVAIEDLSVDYGAPSALARLFGRDHSVAAVRGVSLSIARGEAIGLVGESGCGKSTLARAMLRLVEPASGTVRYDGADLRALEGSDLAAFRSRAQMVFQDPYGSLNPRLTVRDCLDEVLAVHGLKEGAARAVRILELLEMVGLSPEFLDRRPSQLSGGQCQRVGIARALAVEPDLIVADEAIAALDLSIQAQILDLLRDLRRRLGLTLVFITHNLAVVRHLCDRVAVMNAGRIVEEGPAEQVMTAPRHDYTRALLAAMPKVAGPAA